MPVLRARERGTKAWDVRQSKSHCKAWSGALGSCLGCSGVRMALEKELPSHGTWLPVPPRSYLTIQWVSSCGVSDRLPEDGTCENVGSSRGWNVSAVQGLSPISDPALHRAEKSGQMPALPNRGQRAKGAAIVPRLTLQMWQLSSQTEEPGMV